MENKEEKRDETTFIKKWSGVAWKTAGLVVLYAGIKTLSNRSKRAFISNREENIKSIREMSEKFISEENKIKEAYDIQSMPLGYYVASKEGRINKGK